MHESKNLPDDLNSEDHSGPRWLDDLISEYFNDDEFAVPVSSRYRNNTRFMKRGTEKALGANAIFRLRAPLRAKLAEAGQRSSLGLIDLIEAAAREVGVDMEIVGRWLDCEPEEDLDAAIQDPAVFSRLAIGLQLPLEEAIRLQRVTLSKARATQTVAAGPTWSGEARSNATFDSAIDIEAEALLKTWYNEALSMD